MKEQKSKPKAKSKAKPKAKVKKAKAKVNEVVNMEELVSINVNESLAPSAVENEPNLSTTKETISEDFISLDELVSANKSEVILPPEPEKTVATEELHDIDELVKINSNSLYGEIARIHDIPILRDIKGFYESQYNNLFAESRYINKKTSKLFEMSVISLAIFAIYIAYLFTQKYFTTLTYVQIFFVLPLEVGIVLLFMSVYQNFKLQNSQTYFRKVDVNYPVQKAYEKIKAEAKREKEFLVRMIYNYSVIVRENTQLLNEQTHLLNWQYNYFLVTTAIIFVSLIVIVAT